jgi:hypothetical protein
MNARNIALLSLSLTAAALLSSGCVFAIGCPSKGHEACRAPQPPQAPTRGAELIDLQRAHGEGAITQEEYDQAKQRILEK